MMKAARGERKSGAKHVARHQCYRKQKGRYRSTKEPTAGWRSERPATAGSPVHCTRKLSQRSQAVQKKPPPTHQSSRHRHHTRLFPRRSSLAAYG